jgi:hypothetical protein
MKKDLNQTSTSSGLQKLDEATAVEFRTFQELLELLGCRVSEQSFKRQGSHLA